MAVSTKQLEQAYDAYGKAIGKSYDAKKAEYDAAKEKTESDTRTALQDAYTEKIRADYRSGQQSRAAGVTGGAVIGEQIARDNAYLDSRVAAQLGREDSLSAIDRQIKMNDAERAAAMKSNEVSKSSALFNAGQTADNMLYDTYSSFLSAGYLPEKKEDQKAMSDSLGLTPEELSAFIKYTRKL